MAILLEKPLKVISLNGATDTKTGEYVVQINFGEIVENNEEISSRLNFGPEINRSGPRQIGVSTLTIFLKPEHASPFRVNSNWNLVVSDNGTINIKMKK